MAARSSSSRLVRTVTATTLVALRVAPSNTRTRTPVVPFWFGGEKKGRRYDVVPPNVQQQIIAKAMGKPAFLLPEMSLNVPSEAITV